MDSTPVKIQHFSDVLCVWAYAGQIRIDELRSKFGDLIQVECHFLSVFGDMRHKIETNWKERGGVPAFADQMHRAMKQFDHIQLHPELWRRDLPTSSLSCHIFLRAVKLAEEALGATDMFRRATWQLREAFFRDAVDISKRSTQLSVAEQLELPIPAIERHLDDGSAHAVLSRDHALARSYEIKMSPTVVLNEGRQLLSGNVGYRVHEANIRELLHHPAHEASWC